VNEKRSQRSIALARWTKVFAEFPVPQLLMEQNLQVDGWSFSDQPMMVSIQEWGNSLETALTFSLFTNKVIVIGIKHLYSAS